MALDAARTFSRGRIGLGGSIADTFDKFETSTEPRYHVGFKVEEADGTVYRYANFGATVNRGVLVSNDLSESAVTDTDNGIIAPASANDTTDGTLGSKFVQITVASVTAGQFAGGKFITTDDVGEGYTYDIKDNNATGDPATGDFRLELYQKLQVAVDATTDFIISPNKYHNLEITTVATDAIAAGVSCSTIGTAGDYGWIQTKGICGVLQDADAPTIGDAVQVSALTNGAVGVLGATSAGSLGNLNRQAIVGRCDGIGDSTGHSSIDLMLD